MKNKYRANIYTSWSAAKGLNARTLTNEVCKNSHQRALALAWRVKCSATSLCISYLSRGQYGFRVLVDYIHCMWISTYRFISSMVSLFFSSCTLYSGLLVLLEKPYQGVRDTCSRLSRGGRQSYRSAHEYSHGPSQTLPAPSSLSVFARPHKSGGPFGYFHRNSSLRIPTQGTRRPQSPCRPLGSGQASSDDRELEPSAPDDERKWGFLTGCAASPMMQPAPFCQ